MKLTSDESGKNMGRFYSAMDQVLYDFVFHIFESWYVAKLTHQFFLTGLGNWHTILRTGLKTSKSVDLGDDAKVKVKRMT